MKLIIHLLVSTIAVFAGAYILPGVSVNSLTTAFIVAIVLGVINMLLKPILLILTLPITILTLGLFIFVINALMILLVGSIVPGFHVDGFLWAFIYSLIISLIGSVLHSLVD